MAFTRFDPTQTPNVLPKTGGTLTDNIAFNPSTKGLIGTGTNDSAPTGTVGEYIESVTGTAGVGATSVYYDVTSIALTAGDWDVVGLARFESNGGTWSSAILGISTTSGNSVTGLVAGSNQLVQTFANTSTVITEVPIAIPSYRVSIASTTTFYLKARVSFSAGAPNTIGARLSARRIR